MYMYIQLTYEYVSNNEEGVCKVVGWSAVTREIVAIGTHLSLQWTAWPDFIPAKQELREWENERPYPLDDQTCPEPPWFVATPTEIADKDDGDEDTGIKSAGNGPNSSTAELVSPLNGG